MANTNPLQLPSNALIEQLRSQIRRMLVRLDEIRLASSPNNNLWMPPVDVLEMDEVILVHIELPGVMADKVRISLLDNTLKIEGRKERETPALRKEGEDERPIRFVCLERSYGGFAFSVSLRWQIDPAGVKARMADGVLEIRMPKTSTCGREVAIPIDE